MPFDFTPPFTHGPVHPSISNSELIEALNNEYNNNASEWEPLFPTAYKPSSDPIGYWTATIDGFGNLVDNSNYDTLACPDNFLNETTVNVSPLI